MLLSSLFVFFFAFPAKAGIQGNNAYVPLGPRFRGESGLGSGGIR